MPSTFQPLRLAYISIVMAVQEASEAASSSCGLGPRSWPPCSCGSSTVTWWPRTATSCVYFSRRRARARIALPAVEVLRLISAISALLKGIEHHPGQHLGEEVRGLGRHGRAGGGDRADLLDRG